MRARRRSLPRCACSATSLAGWRNIPARRLPSVSRPRCLRLPLSDGAGVSALPPGAVLTDIEGTTTPISFVRDVLFPFARERLPGFLAARAGDATVAGELAETRRLVPGKPELETLLGWMAADAKMTPLKALQGMIWHEGYLDGSLAGRIYPDVPPSLRRWSQAGLRLYVYSSG